MEGQSWSDLFRQVHEREESGEPTWIIPHALAFGCVTLFSGQPKVGKTTSIIELVCAVAAGEPSWLGLPVQTHGIPILFVDADRNDPRSLRDKIERTGATPAQMDATGSRRYL